MIFRKQKMIDRLTSEGRYDEIDDNEMEIMELLDGHEATDICWDRQIYGMPVMYVRLEDGTGYYVNEDDCE